MTRFIASRLGEYVPLRDEFPWMQYFAPYDDDYSVSPGRSETRFILDQGTDRPYSFGVVICYEDADAVRALPYVSGGGGSQSISCSTSPTMVGSTARANTTNIWPSAASAPSSVVAAVARAVNMGISALIDGNGRVVAPRPVEGMEWSDAKVRKTITSRFGAMTAADRKLAVSMFPDNDKAAVWLASPSRGAAGLPTARWADYKKVAGVLLADMPIDHRFSLYARWGDWLPLGCWAFLGLGVLLAWARRPRHDERGGFTPAQPRG